MMKGDKLPNCIRKVSAVCRGKTLEYGIIEFSNGNTEQLTPEKLCALVAQIWPKP